ncbi:MAG: GNAT family N-acetyltransferase [Kiloniellaceae bacterium]
MASGAARVLVRVRDAVVEDLPRIQEIYAHHVRYGLASFEETPPNLEEMGRRYEATLAQGLPYLAARVAGPEAKDAVAGYAYAGRYRPRPAYRYTVENSLYVAPGCEGRGIGRALLEELIRRCTDLGYRQMVAVIGDSGHLASIRLHEAFGFVRAGELRSVGFKSGRWVDTVIMQLALGDGDARPPNPARDERG